MKVQVSDGSLHYHRLYEMGSTASKMVIALAKGDGDMKHVVKLLLADETTKEEIQSQTLSAVDVELEHLCSKKEPSILRSTPAPELHKLTSEKLVGELKDRAPIFYKFLHHVCYSKGTKYSQHQGRQAVNSGKIVSPAAVILKTRCKSMMAWAGKNALALQYGGCSNMVKSEFHWFN